VASSVASTEQIAATGVVRELLAAWRDAKDLIDIDAYVAGTNPVVDRAIRLKPRIDAFCQQRVNEPSELVATRGELLSLVSEETS
jgi:flagellum-specific ATP synthase